MVHDGAGLRGAWGNAGEIGHITGGPGRRPLPLRQPRLPRALRLARRLRAASATLGEDGWLAERGAAVPHRDACHREPLRPADRHPRRPRARPLLERLVAAASPLANSVAARRDRRAPRLTFSGVGQHAVLRGAAALAVSGVLSPRFGMLFAEGPRPAARDPRARSNGSASGMSEPLLRLHDITKRYGAIEALRGVTFDRRPGEVVALLGDNGAGKSTLVKIISGGLEPTSGRMLFEGRDHVFATPSEAKAAGIETVYQDLSLCTNVDVVGNFFMGREITRASSASRCSDEKAMEPSSPRRSPSAGTRIPSLRTRVEHLSGGQRQAIELNRFVHWGGKLVLLDEPFAALGVEQTRRGLDMIRASRNQGIGVVIITHIMRRPSRSPTGSW
jgi:D-xylose transport system ATP-binding protein